MFERPRYFWIGVITALAITAVCTLAAVSSSSGGDQTPVPDVFTVTGAPVKPQPPGMPIGLDYGDTLFKAAQATIDSGFDDATAIGASWIRVDLPWDGIQSFDSTTSYDWSHFDRLVAAADSRDLKMLVTVVDPPVWARDPACITSEACQPVVPLAYADFAALAAKRYAPAGVHDWEIWNEENLGSFATSSNPAAAYSHLLAATYTALRQADPKAVVILGGLGITGNVPSRSWISPYDFLSGIAKVGGLRYADAIGVHPYGWPDLPVASPVFAAIDSAPKSLQSILNAYGASKLPFWITETGAPTWGAGPTADGVFPAQGATHVTLSLQAEIATSTVQTETADPHIKALFWYSDKDTPGGGLTYGLRTDAGTIKPSFAALKQAIAAYRAKLTQ